ncbi:MAG TPA: TRAP transporter small permease [Rubrivivax sp.]|nr:TRAP transporter small permease [Rubrivivax sp.]HPO21166.1 TRAP transporter small permease [Rubrivivax sp.]
MQEPVADNAARPGSGFGPAGRVLLAVSKTLAVVGGLVFVALVAMSIVSITGRKLFAAPLPGDVEVLQMCAAVASACFFAYCHLANGDVKVDFFTHNLSTAKVAAMDAFGSLLVGLFGALLAWRTAAGAWAVQEAGETSAILGWPVWLAQALMVPGFALLAAAGFYMAGVRLRTVMAARARAAW